MILTNVLAQKSQVLVVRLGSGLVIRDSLLVVRDSVLEVRDSVLVVKDSVLVVKDSVLMVRDSVSVVRDSVLVIILIKELAALEIMDGAILLDFGVVSSVLDLETFLRARMVA